MEVGGAVSWDNKEVIEFTNVVYLRKWNTFLYVDIPFKSNLHPKSTQNTWLMLLYLA